LHCERFEKLDALPILGLRRNFLKGAKRSAAAEQPLTGLCEGLNMGYNACDELSKLRNVLDQFELKSQIIAASTMEILNMIERLEAGAHIVTVQPNLLEGMIVHPYSKETVKMFLDDASKANNLK
jgi:transaldolase